MADIRALIKHTDDFNCAIVHVQLLAYSVINIVPLLLLHCKNPHLEANFKLSAHELADIPNSLPQ